ncbi:MAG: cation:proton antiporter [Pseudomonadota bacterium]
MSNEFMIITFALFLAGIIAVPLAKRSGLGSVLGYLLAGIALGPVLSFVGADVTGMQHFSEFGVVMMLFIIGLEMSPRALWDMRARIFALGGLQVGITALIVCAIALLFSQPWTVGIAIGMILALSSTAIVNQTLNEKGLLKSDGGQASFAVLLFQDIAVIPMLVVIPLLALPELAGSGTAAVDSHAAGEGALHLNLVENLPAWQTAIVTVAAIGAVIFAGRYLTDPVFRFVSRARLRELFVMTALMIVLAITILMTMVGLSAALGTFLAGVVMANSEFRHELESDINPFKGIFLGIFFMTVGAGIDFAFLFANVSLVIGLTLGLIILKIAVLSVLARVFKIAGGDKWLFSLGLAQAGEFGFVLLSFSVASAALPTDIADILLLVVALSMLVTPALFILYDRVIAPRYSVEQEREADEIDSDAKIIIAGHGRFGGIVNRALSGAGYDTVVVDYSSDQLEMLRSFGMRVHYGDATRHDLLEAAGLENAHILVIAIDDKQAITQLARYVCKAFPHVHVVARAIDRTHVYDLWSVGCRDIIRETYDSSLRAARSALEALGIERPEAERMMAVFEQVDRSSMVELAGLYDIDIPVQDNDAYMQKAREMRAEWEQQLKGKMRPSAD